jgi:hypothetical protein
MPEGIHPGEHIERQQNNVVSLLKRLLSGTHQGAVQPKHLQGYLEEYTFRLNSKNSSQRGLLFYRFLENAMLIGPLTYRKLVDG